MPSDIVRHSKSLAVTFTTTTGTTGGFLFGKAAGGVIYVTSGTATLTWYVKSDDDGATAFALYADGAAVTTAVQSGRAYAIPDAAFGAGYVFAVSSSGSVVATVTLKG